MPRVIRLHEATRHSLPGRTSHEIVSATTAGAAVTLRRVEIPPGRGEEKRGQHRHATFEECIYVLSGRGMTTSNGADVEVGPGDTILVPAGELHATRNVGDDPLVLLCFFPVGDIRPGTEEQKASSAQGVAPSATPQPK